MLASVELACSQELAFTALTDPVVYSRWLGVPVQIEDGQHHLRRVADTQASRRRLLHCVRGASAVAAPVLVVAMRRANRKDFRTLEAILETEARS